MTNHKGLDRRLTRMVWLGYALIATSAAIEAAGLLLDSPVLVIVGSLLATVNLLLLFVNYQMRKWLRSR